MTGNLPFDFIPDTVKNTITVKREFKAGRQLVWDCYTQSDLLDRWFAPAPLTTKTKSMDFSEGGHWHYAMVDPEGGEYWGYIEYLTLHPIDSYTSTHAFTDEDRNINPDLPRAEWLVTFTEQGENAVVETVVTYKSLADLEQVIQMGVETGMSLTMAKLDDLLAELAGR